MLQNSVASRLFILVGYRTFRVEIGVPQDVWTSLLFLIAINDLSVLTSPLPNVSLDPLHLLTLYKARDSSKLLLIKISTWSSDRGFCFSNKKTVMVVFRRRFARPIPNQSPDLC